MRSDTYNRLDQIDRDSPLALDECFNIARALVVRSGEEKEPHWLDSAETWIAAMTAWVLHAAPAEVRNLQSVAEILARPQEIAEALRRMQQSPAWGGMLARLAYQLGHYQDKELGSTLTTACRFLRFLSTPPVAASVESTSFDLSQLRQGRFSAYLVLPTEFLRTQSPLLRLWVSGFLRAVIQGGAHERNPVLFLLDEAAALGHMDVIDDAVTQLRGYGLRLFFIYQSMGQLEKCFPEGQARTFLDNMDNQIFFGANALEDAEYVSKRLGSMTIQVCQQSGGGNWGVNTDAYGMENRSRGGNDGYSISQTGRELLKPEEVLALDERQTVVFTPGVLPLMTRLVRYYEREFRTARGGNRWLLALQCLAFAVSGVVTVVVVLSTLAARPPAPPSPSPPVPLWQQPAPWPPPWPGP